ncbi:MAG: secondary thiamine-phosphate synthase enzyme YjbQ [Thermoleophilia bacterium]
MRQIAIQTSRRTEVVNVTDEVLEACGDLGDAAAVVVYVPHTSAGVVIQEHADPLVARDLEMAFERIVDDAWPYQHIEEGEVNPWSHVRSAITASSVTIPVDGGKLALGTWQGVFFCEFDGPRARKLYVQPLR